jgi:hypothetical protein
MSARWEEKAGHPGDARQERQIKENGGYSKLFLLEKEIIRS